MKTYAPFNYEQINAYEGTYFPSSVKARNNASFAYWQRALFQRACSVIKLDVDGDFKGEIKDFLYYCLFRFGFVTVFDSPEFGFAFQPCNLYGYDFYYQPTECIIANPAYNATLKIHEECELMKLTPDFMGVFDIINYYAEKLSSLDSAINMSIINNKIPMILTAKNKAAAETLKKIVDKANNGEPLIVTDKIMAQDEDSKEQALDMYDRQHLKNCYITSDQLMDMQTILNSFDCEIGIPTVPYQKKERMVTSEADSKQLDALARCTIWVDTLNNSFDVINAKFGKTFKASLNYEEVLSYGEDNNAELGNMAR